MKKIILITALILLSVACDQNQRVANKLAGEWNVTSYTVNTTNAGSLYLNLNEIKLVYNFDNCEIAEGNDCSLLTIINENSTNAQTIIEKRYTIEGDGYILKILTNSIEQKFIIKSISSKYLELESLNNANETNIAMAKK